MKTQLTIALVALAATACGTRTDSVTIRTPNGTKTRTLNAGPFSHDTTTTVTTDAAYENCLSQNSYHMGPDAEFYCRDVTTDGVSGDMQSYGGRRVPVVQGRPYGRSGIRAWAEPGTHSMDGYSVGQPPLIVEQAGDPKRPNRLVTSDEHRRSIAPLYEATDALKSRVDKQHGKPTPTPAPAGEK